MLKPIYTEKSLKEVKDGNYTFRVTLGMNKKQIASEVARIFGVTVVKVRTVRTGPEKGRNIKGKKFSKPGIKKAVVTLKSGDKIDIFEEGKK